MRRAVKRQFFKDMILSRHQPPGPFPLVVVLDHLKPTFNVGKIVRTANGMGLRELHFIGIPFFNPGPTMGALRHTRSRSFDTFRESYDALTQEGYTLFALVPEATQAVGECTFPLKTAFIIGHEEWGIQVELDEYPDIRLVTIPQFGVVQSLNASIAMAIASYEYLRQNALLGAGRAPAPLGGAAPQPLQDHRA